MAKIKSTKGQTNELQNIQRIVKNFNEFEFDYIIRK